MKPQNDSIVENNSFLNQTSSERVSNIISCNDTTNSDHPFSANQQIVQRIPDSEYIGETDNLATFALGIIDFPGINPDGEKSNAEYETRTSILRSSAADRKISVSYRLSQSIPIPNLVAFQVQCGSTPPAFVGLSYATILHSVITENEFNSRIQQISQVALIGFKSKTIVIAMSIILLIGFSTIIVTFTLGIFYIPIISFILVFLIVYRTLYRAKTRNQQLKKQMNELLLQFNHKDKGVLKWKFESLVATRLSKVKTFNVTINVCS
jgi:hypothetical protein